MFVLETVQKATKTIIKKNPVNFLKSFTCVSSAKLFLIIHLLSFSVVDFYEPCAFLTHYQMTNFRLFQTERVCRRKFQIRQKWYKVVQTGIKNTGKRRNCSLRTISPFLMVFSKGLFPRGVKRCHCVGMG